MVYPGSSTDSWSTPEYNLTYLDESYNINNNAVTSEGNFERAETPTPLTLEHFRAMQQEQLQSFVSRLDEFRTQLVSDVWTPYSLVEKRMAAAEERFDNLERASATHQSIVSRFDAYGHRITALEERMSRQEETLRNMGSIRDTAGTSTARAQSNPRNPRTRAYCPRCWKNLSASYVKEHLRAHCPANRPSNPSTQ